MSRNAHIERLVGGSLPRQILIVVCLVLECPFMAVSNLGFKLGTLQEDLSTFYCCLDVTLCAH